MGPAPDFNASQVVELLREQLLALHPDLSEVGPVLHAIAADPAFSVALDYAVQLTARRLDQLPEDAATWEALALLLQLAPRHAALPDAAALQRACSAAAPLPTATFAALAAALRAGRLPVASAITQVAAGLLGGTAGPLDPLPACLTALFTAAWPAPEVHPSLRDLTALLRGADAWDARGAAARLLGRRDTLPPEVSAPLFAAWRAAAEAGGAPYLKHPVGTGPIGMRQTAYAPLERFVEVMLPTCAVAELRLHRAAWLPAVPEAAGRLLWDEARDALALLRIDLPTWELALTTPNSPLRLFLGHDEELALQTALAASASLLAIGDPQAARALAGRLTSLEGPTPVNFYRRRAAELAR